ncbi:polysaccharide biosynthesis/export family protein [Novosphingobium sp. TH158]|uniref:polysaccharide biosynthesis/export family protein n=1 Tax=Novosphingobium sp. TH158 TaxID=2067455 RepID=UPI001304154F|nr:polysaccharide biosynthesis/export family protein [Novosphingobium sp. TH158]
MGERIDRLRGAKGTGHKRIARVLAATLVVTVLGGCEMRGGKLPYAPADFGAPDRNGPVREAYDVPLGPLDIIRVNVFRVPELSGEYQVDGFGMVNLPLVGQTSVRDMDSAEFAKRLETLYGQKYLQNPEVSVRVVTTNQLNITIEGGVNSPGIYALPGRTTLVGAIAMARGLTVSESNPKRIAIFRKRDGKTVGAAFDLVSIRHGEMADPVVYPGDTIVVDGSKVRAIYRDILNSLPLIAVFNSL